MIYELWDRFDPRHKLFCNTDGGDGGGNQNDGGGNQNDGGSGNYSGSYGGNYNDPAGFGAGGTRSGQEGNDVAAYSAAQGAGTTAGFVGGYSGGNQTASQAASQGGNQGGQGSYDPATMGDAAGTTNPSLAGGSSGGTSISDIAAAVGRALGISTPAAAADLQNPNTPLGQIAQQAANNIYPGLLDPKPISQQQTPLFTETPAAPAYQPPAVLSSWARGQGIMPAPGSPFDMSNPIYSNGLAALLGGAQTGQPPAAVPASVAPGAIVGPGSPFYVGGAGSAPAAVGGEPGSNFNYSPGVFSANEQAIIDSWGGQIPGDTTTPQTPITKDQSRITPGSNMPTSSKGADNTPATPADGTVYKRTTKEQGGSQIGQVANDPNDPNSPNYDPGPFRVSKQPTGDGGLNQPGMGDLGPPTNTSGGEYGTRVQQGSAVLPGLGFNQTLDMSQLTKLAQSGTVPLSQIASLAQQQGISLSGNALNQLTGSTFGRGD